MEENHKDLPESDLCWAVKKIFENHFSKKETHAMWIGNTCTADYDKCVSDEKADDFVHHSDSRLCHYYLRKIDLADKKIFEISHKVDV